VRSVVRWCGETVVAPPQPRAVSGGRGARTEEVAVGWRPSRGGACHDEDEDGMTWTSSRGG
jgi:hypothetical protein